MRQAKGDVEPKMVEELTWSKRTDINAFFDDGNPLPRPFNIGSNYGGITISLDNKVMIVAKKNPKPKNQGNFDLFGTRYTKKIDDKGNKIYVWEELIDLGPNVNTDNGWEGQPTLSGDGQMLVFATVREGTIKDGSGNPSHDLFYCLRQPDGTWGVAQPLKGNINTKGQEKGPYFHSDSKTLYFSSDGHLGVGGLDIFYTKMNDDLTFTEIKNIGFPINDENDQIGVVVSSDGELGYFGAKKFRGERTWDVYSFQMPPPAKPEKVMVVKGNVQNKEGEPAANASVEIKYSGTGETEKVKVNDDDGSYATIMKVGTGQDVTLSVKGDDVAFNTRVISHKEDTIPPVVIKLDMKTETLVNDQPFPIPDIVYGTNKAEIKESSLPILREFAVFMNEHPNMVIEIRGHTDASGRDEDNLALSMERAFEVMNFLVKSGVDGKRITARGYGETQPIAPNDTEEGRSKNRRTEFFVKSM
jgi:outer membrane protein OmpA-like peptidoglycan-associated protein